MGLDTTMYVIGSSGEAMFQPSVSGPVLITYASFAVGRIPYDEGNPDPIVRFDVILTNIALGPPRTLETLYLRSGDRVVWSMDEGRPIIPGGIYPAGTSERNLAILVAGGLPAVEVSARFDWATAP